MVAKPHQSLPHPQGWLTRHKTKVDDRKRQFEEAELQVAREERAFWFRRFYTSITLGHAAGFLSIGAAVIQADNISVVAKVSLFPIVFFAAGLILAGSMSGLLAWFAFRRFQRIVVGKQNAPELISRGENYTVAFFTILSLLLFGLGVGASVYAVYQLDSSNSDGLTVTSDKPRAASPPSTQ